MNAEPADSDPGSRDPAAGLSLLTLTQGVETMRKQLTNQWMLRAAQQRLAEHMATRPATRAEADTIRQTHLDAAVELEADAKSVIYQPRTAAEIGRGKHAVGDQHQEGIRHSQSLTESLHLRAMAAKERLHAAAWECDSDDMTAIWEATRSELQARVDHYQRLVDDVESA